MLFGIRGCVFRTAVADQVSVRKQRIYTQTMKKQKTKKQIMKKRLDEYAVGSADNDEDATKMTIVVAIIAMMK